MSNIETAHVSQKNYNYKKGNVSLGFSLGVDASKDMGDFMELLHKAAEDIVDDLKKLSEKVV